MKMFWKKTRGGLVGAILFIAVLAACLYMAAPYQPPVQAAITTPPIAMPGVQVIPLTAWGNTVSSGTHTLFKLKLPFAAKLLGVSAWVGHADLTTGDETYTMSISGSSAGNLVTPFAVNTPAAVQEASVVNSAISDEETITISLATGGTTPAWTNATVALTVARK